VDSVNPDPHSDGDPKFFKYLLLSSKKIHQALDPDPQIFHTLDQSPQLMDADPKP